MAAVLRRLRDLQSSAGNKICVDWSQKNPQWASVSYGVFIASARYRSTKDIYTQSQLEASAANKEGFFTRKMAENESRPEGLPPSQGGKYVGFGSSPTSSPQRRNDAQNDYFSAVSQGIGKLSLVAASAANVVQAGTKEFTSKVFCIGFVHFQGLGCSSVGYGATQDIGPFLVDTDGRGLKFNNFSWNKGSKIEVMMTMVMRWNDGDDGGGGGGENVMMTVTMVVG
ncbi:hypothetical protein JHK84_033912 [Glycine max]|nr:hypothetical protein JHK85_034295 [Glycine max]KAG4985968.1 hypothetical protein JHK86_033659 [Glycine max]KAG5140144.1 hypothetical protein JHK84_033912 [Glycine max]